MDVFLMGYMGSGKSTIGPLLAAKLNIDFIDFDTYICKSEGLTIPQLFNQKGEIYFRKKEAFYLKEIINNAAPNKKRVISLGGGTPCYGNNLNHIQEAGGMSIYLKWNIVTLANRLWRSRAQRPLIANQQTKELLEEFVRKHLFERGFYYNQSNAVLSMDGKTPKEVVAEIAELL